MIECIDLFDEARYGADKLFFRGRFDTLEDVKKQVEAALSDEQFTDENGKSIIGNGNPLAQGEDAPIIALNRFEIPNKKFWNNTPPSDIANPYKASAAVTFSIRVHFRDDFAYINFGCPWSELITDEETEDGRNITIDSGSELIPHFKLLSCHFISKVDAIAILNGLGLSAVISWDKNFVTRTEATNVLELTDEDGSVISLD